MTRLFYILILFAFTFSSEAQLSNKLDAFESIFTDYNKKSFHSAFTKVFESEFSSDDFSILDLYLKDKLLPNYPENKKLTYFLLDSLYLEEMMYSESSRICESLLERELKAEVLDTINTIKLKTIYGGLIFKNGDRNLALEHSNQALDLINSRTPIDTFQKVNLLYEMNFMYRYSEAPKMVMKVLKEAEFLMMKNPDFDIVLKSIIYKEISKQNLGKGYLKEAEYYLDKAWEIRDTADGMHFSDPHKESSFLYDYMYFCLTSNNTEHAQKLLKRADHFLSTNPKLDQEFIDALAAVYNDYGELVLATDPRKAIPYYKKAMKINESGRPGFQVQYLFNLTKAYLYTEQFAKLEESGAQLLKLAVETNDIKLPFVHAMIGSIKLEQNNLNAAITAFQDMVNAISQGTDKVILADNDLDAYAPTYHFHVVSGLYLKMVERIKKQFPDHPDAKKVIYNLYHISLKQFYKSIENQKINKKIELTLADICKGLIEYHKQGVTPSLPLEEMILASEKVKSGFLWENFKQNNASINIKNQEFAAQEKELSNEIIKIKKAQAKTKYAELNSALIDKEKELEALEYQKKLEQPLLENFEHFQFDLQDYFDNMPEDRLTLRYDIYKDDLYLYQIASNDLRLLKIGDIDSLSESTSRFLNLIMDPHSSQNEIANLGKYLHDKLIPIDLNAFSSINIISEGFLHYLPFELIRNEDYLINQFDISYSISLSLANLNKTPTKISKIGLFAPSYKLYKPESVKVALRGDPYNLQGSLDEVDALSTILPSKVFSNEEASKANFLSEGPGFDVLHFAMHSFTNDHDPELNSLIFSDNVIDNEFYLNELYFMKLNARMAVLSACNTGVVSDNHGEGIISMNRAFTYAGVPSVISSLWSAPDQSTREIMQYFYTDLKKGFAKDEALRNAKLHYLENHKADRSDHPFYWAPFILHGDISPFELERTGLGSYSWAAMILFSLLAIALILVLILKKKQLFNLLFPM